MRIGIFDSGIGGINVLSTLVKEYPNNEYIFYGDTKNLPYGDKSHKELFSLASKAIEFLLTKNVDIIIIACGTISSTCYDLLKKKYHIPIYDIISPTIKYLKKSNYNNIGVIATKRTIESNIFNIKNKNVLMQATPTFVPIIENGQIDEYEKEIIDELRDFKNMDVLVLGCTHYPALKDIIEKNIKIPTIDMGKCLLKTLNIKNSDKKNIELYFTLLSPNLIINIDKILKDKYNILAI